MDYEHQAQFMEIKPKFRGVLTRLLTEALCSEEYEFSGELYDDNFYEQNGISKPELGQYLKPFH